MVIATRLPIIVLGVVVALLIPAPFTESSPELNDLYENFLGQVIIVAALTCVLIAGVVGAAVMMGWRAGIIGVIFAASIAAAGAGAVTGDALWTNLGIAGFAASVIGYFFIGELSGYLPMRTARAYGSVAMIPGGVVMGVIGIFSGNQALALIGFGSAAAAVGVTAARWLRTRRMPQPAPEP
ncbi:hypothetical protein [Agromyces subbeticus]|uniref:hypothetical protein n=1 Tax=Agromyces subbeticus TaxID=293890 RepID=UPI0003B5F206|nr:hypothetical protein [Agromyces subbeticus]